MPIKEGVPGLQRGPKAKPPRLTYSIFRSDCHLPAMDSADSNLPYRANDVTLKTAIENRFPIKVDQAVVAYSSDGRSRGCAFVTVRWKEYLNSHTDSNSQSLVQKFCHSMTCKPLFGQPVFVELRACNQRRGGLFGFKRRSTSAHTHMAFWSSSYPTDKSTPLRWRPTHWQEEHYNKHGELGSHSPL